MRKRRKSEVYENTRLRVNMNFTSRRFFIMIFANFVCVILKFRLALSYNL